jgi:hypothetical protein
MARVRVFGGRRVRGRLYRVVIEITYVGGRLADEVREMLAAEIRIPDGGERRDVVITASPGSFTIIAVSATVDAANPRAALAVPARFFVSRRCHKPTVLLRASLVLGRRGERGRWLRDSVTPDN